MSEPTPTATVWRAPTGFGLLLLAGAVAAAASGMSPLWIGVTALALLVTGKAVLGTLRNRFYLRQLLRHVDRVPLAAATDLKLTDVYIDVGVKPADSDTGAECPFVGTDRHADRRVPLLSRLRRSRPGPTVILGEPGSGRTTVLRRSAVELATRRHGPRRLPILVDLTAVAERLTEAEPPDLPRLAAEAAWLRGVPSRWFARQLARGRCTVMLDGLDETGSATRRRAVAEWITAQHRRYRRNSFLVTSRPNGLSPDSLPHAEYWRLRHLTDSQIAAFLHDWCSAVESRKPGHSRGWVRDGGAAEAGVLLSRLRAHPALHELAALPLPLTLLALVHRRCGLLPEDRESLYREALAVLVSPEHLPIATALARRGMERCRGVLTAADLAELAPDTDVADLLREGWSTRADVEGLAFAHPSLRQYLAGLDLTEAEILQRIDDPWWRDAVLLWAARTDATHVIDACLASGTITALSLAFDAAAAAGELAPATLSELRELLTLATKTPDENRLVGAVKVSRELADMTPLYGGGRLARRPVSNSLYSSFLEAEFPAGRPPPDASETSAAVGVWPSEAQRFLGWVNALPGGGDTRFRLPTEGELLAPQCRPHIEGRSVWVDGGDRPRLAHFGATRDPYTVGRDWWPRVATADRRRITLSLYLLAQVLGRTARPLAKDMAGEMNLDRTRAFALPRELRADTELAATRLYLNQHPPTPGSPDPELPGHLEHVADLLAELSAKALDFRGDATASERANLPFTYLDRLTGDQRHLLATAVTTLWFCSPATSDKPRYGATLARFDEYLEHGVIDAAERRSRTVPPELLLTALREATTLLTGDAQANPWLGLAADTLSRVADRLATTLSHNTSYTVDEVACARVAVTAVAAVVTAHPSPGATLEELATVLAGLTVLEDRATGTLVPNEVLLLARS